MSRIRYRAAILLAAIPLALGAVIAASPPASAAVPFTQQCDQSGDCLNLWAGGYAIRVWHGTGFDNWLTIQWISPGVFQLDDNVHGGCAGDYGNSPSDARMQGGLACPSGGNGAWGSTFGNGPSCGNGWRLYYSRHWNAYVGFNVAQGSAVYENTGGICLKQLS